MTLKPDVIKKITSYAFVWYFVKLKKNVLSVVLMNKEFGCNGVILCVSII